MNKIEKETEKTSNQIIEGYMEVTDPSMQSRWKNDQNSFLIEKTVPIQLVFVFGVADGGNF